MLQKRKVAILHYPIRKQTKTFIYPISSRKTHPISIEYPKISNTVKAFRNGGFFRCIKHKKART
jgi:hypothetical protein